MEHCVLAGYPWLPQFAFLYSPGHLPMCGTAFNVMGPSVSVIYQENAQTYAWTNLIEACALLKFLFPNDLGLCQADFKRYPTGTHRLRERVSCYKYLLRNESPQVQTPGAHIRPEVVQCDSYPRAPMQRWETEPVDSLNRHCPAKLVQTKGNKVQGDK